MITSIIPAICYESTQPIHAEKAFRLGGDVYLATVMEHHEGLEASRRYYSDLARKYHVPVLMCNGIGPSGSFVSAGGSGVWDETGTLKGALPEGEEGLLIYDLESKDVTFG